MAGRLGALGLAVALGLTMIHAGWAARPAAADELFSESFRNDSTPGGGWTALSAFGKHRPCLTAATRNVSGSLSACNAVRAGTERADRDGDGAAQLSNNDPYEAGALLLDKAIKADLGLHIKFDMYQFNAKPHNGRGGDGISFFLIDGKQQRVAPGQAGGMLAYKNLRGGLIGVGFDEYGNFSNSPGVFTTGPGQRPNSVVLRGAESTSYRYIAGTSPSAPLAVDKALHRDRARREVTINMSTSNILSVSIDFQDGLGEQRLISKINLNAIPGQPRLPETIKLGFAASTGTATAYHEIRNFSIATLRPNLNVAVSHDGSFTQGGTGQLKIDVGSDAEDGPTTSPITTSVNMPAGLTPKSASGDGWKCRTPGRMVLCTRPGTGPDSLAPGESFPPITVNTTVSSDAPPQATVQATVETPDEFSPADNTVNAPVVIAPKPPDLTIKATHDGPWQAGGKGTITAVVSNLPDAGPATGPTTAAIPAPAGSTIVSAKGDGWDCIFVPAPATCTRPDTLDPGKSFPPVKVGVVVPKDTPDTVAAGGSVSTPGDLNLPNNTVPAVIVPIKTSPPDLGVTIDASGDFAAEGKGTLTAKVSNSAEAGPTKGAVVVAIPLPHSIKVTSVEAKGWACATTGGAVTCIRPGTGSDAVPGGKSYPKIDVATTAEPLTVSAKVGTPGDSNDTNDTAKTRNLPAS